MSQDPSFYIAIFSSVCFFASELLPFIPIKSNGIIHSIIEFLKKTRDNSVKKNQEIDNENTNSIINIKLNNINKKIDKLIEKINSEKNIV